MTDHLSLEDLLDLVDDLRVGPLRDLGLLDSAAHRPQTSLWGREAYPTLVEKAAALLEALVRNHPLVDGDKRLGWLATVAFLDINGAWVEAPDDDAYDLVIAVASGRPAVAETLARWHQLVAAFQRVTRSESTCAGHAPRARPRGHGRRAGAGC